MVSQVLANAILNQKGPDILGSFREGQELAKGKQVKQLAGEALQAGGGERLQELIGLDPEVGYALAEAIGARNAKELNRFVGNASIADNFLKTGQNDAALQFMEDAQSSLRNLGGDTTQYDKIIKTFREQGPIAAGNQINAFTSVFNKSKQVTSAMQDRESEAQALVGSIDPSTGIPFTTQTANTSLVRLGVGIDATQGTLSAQERLSRSLEDTQDVAESQAIISAAKERAILDVKGELAPDIAGNKATAIRKAIDQTTSGALDISTDQLALDEATRKRETEISQSTATKTAALAEADGAIDRIDGLLSKNRFTSGFGKSVILTPDLAKSQASLDVIAELDQIRGLVSLESRQKLAGQGTISDSESQTLEKSATVLSNPLISNSLARSELIKIRGVFESVKKRNQLKEQQEKTQILNFDAQGNII